MCFLIKIIRFYRLRLRYVAEKISALSIFYIFQKIKIIPFLNGMLYINIFFFFLYHMKRYIKRIHSWDMQWLSIFYEIKNEKDVLNILWYGYGLAYSKK